MLTPPNIPSSQEGSPFNAPPMCQWHESRIRDLEMSLKGITGELIPVIVRLETKMDSVVEKVENLSDTVREFRIDLGNVQESLAKESMENVGRDLSIKTIGDEFLTRKQQRNAIYWGFGKVLFTVVATVIATALLILLKLKP